MKSTTSDPPAVRARPTGMTTKKRKRRAPAPADPQLRFPPGIVTAQTRPIVKKVVYDAARGWWMATVDYRDGLPPRRFPTLGPRAIRYLESFCVCTNGHWIGVPLRLIGWQKDWIIELFELDPETEKRRYREALLGIPKKNGKSEMLAGLAHYFLEADGEPAAKIIVGGAGEISAGKIFDPAKVMVARCDTAKVPGILAELCDVFDEEIQLRGAPESKIIRVAGSPKRSEGENVSHALLDEWHEWDEPRLEQNADKILNGTVNRLQPFVLKITGGTCRRFAGAITSTGSAWRRRGTGGSSSAGSKRRRNWTGGARLP